tara:strand:+ start:326 stop:994 length:669 start_codon:yes stop_codon:yes gene_type:complete
MPQSIDKKKRIIIYLTFLLILSTVSSKTLDNDKIYSIKINVTGLSNSNNLQLVNKLNDLFYKNIFFINKDEIKKIISVNNIIEEYNVRKIYPSKLDIDIKLTKFIAKISANKKLIVGSNGKLIKSETIHDSLPYIFGEFNSKKFLEFKKHIDHSEFNFKDLRSVIFFPSNRWDILTSDDILIKLPEKNLIKSLSLAHKLINDGLLKNNKIIDLRVTKHLVLK